MTGAQHDRPPEPTHRPAPWHQPWFLLVPLLGPLAVIAAWPLASWPLRRLAPTVAAGWQALPPWLRDPGTWPFFDSLVKALDLVVWWNITVLLVLYAWAWWEARATNKSVFSRRLIQGIVIGWTGAGIYFGNFVVLYWVMTVSAERSVAVPWVRLLYLSFLLVGTSRHNATAIIDNDPEPSLFGRWTGCLLAATAAVFALDYWDLLPALAALLPAALRP